MPTNNRLNVIPAIVRTVEEGLESLSVAIRVDIEAFVQGDINQLQLALCAGEKLERVRKQCRIDRVPFTKWIKDHVSGISQRTVYRLLKIYEKREMFATVANIGYTDALKLAYGVEDDDGEDEPPLPEYITLDDWQEMGVKPRANVLRTVEGNKQFNTQENDSIEWALWSWNPVTGCLHDCPYCYARDIAQRFYQQKFKPSLWPVRLTAPSNTHFPAEKAAEWMGHKNVFVCSMADLFGRWVPKEWIDAVLERCAVAPQWNYLFLTKFPNRMSEFEFSDNCWVGTTVDCQARVRNAEKAFRKVKAKVKWLSCEPLIEALKFSDIGAFHWVVIGGASASNKTPEWHPPRRWVTNLEAAVWDAGGKVYEKSNLFPTDIGQSRVREYPGVEVINPTAPAPMIYLPQEIG